MPVIPSPEAPTHDLGGTRFHALAAPSRGARETSVWMVEIDPGTEPVPHAVTREEVFVVLGGAAHVALGGTTAIAGVGDAIVVPPHVEFAIASAGDEPVRLVCCLPVGGQAVTAAGTFTPPWAE